MHSGFVNRDGWRWKAWICECTNRDCQVVFQSLRLVVDGCSAGWTKVELDARALVTYPDVLR